MRLAPLCEMDVRYTEVHWVQPLNGPGGSEGQGWGLREGAVRGERIRGMHKSFNHPYRRSDDITESRVHGMITTDEGALIYYEIGGYLIPDPAHPTRRIIGTARFRSVAPGYEWLNTTIATLEARYQRDAEGTLFSTFQIYECVMEVE